MAKRKHPGFSKVATSIAKKEHIPIAQARAELASATRGAGAAAKRANSHLKRVK